MNRMMQGEDARELVHFPGPLREQEQANMRDHFLTLRGSRTTCRSTA